jgi:hypothetical protein
LPRKPDADRNTQGFSKYDKGQYVPDYVAIGFDKIDRDLKFLIECLGSVLENLGCAISTGHLLGLVRC